MFGTIGRFHGRGTRESGRLRRLFHAERFRLFVSECACVKSLTERGRKSDYGARNHSSLFTSVMDNIRALHRVYRKKPEYFVHVNSFFDVFNQLSLFFCVRRKEIAVSKGKTNSVVRSPKHPPSTIVHLLVSRVTPFIIGYCNPQCPFILLEFLRYESFHVRASSRHPLQSI